MAQPLDPLTPVLPPRPPLRHRVPGQRPGTHGEPKDDEPGSDDAGGAVDDPTPVAPEADRSPDPEGSGDDDHLIDDYA